MIKREYLLCGFVSRKITTRAMKKQDVNKIFIKHDNFPTQWVLASWWLWRENELVKPSSVAESWSLDVVLSPRYHGKDTGKKPSEFSWQHSKMKFKYDVIGVKPLEFLV